MVKIKFYHDMVSFTKSLEIVPIVNAKKRDL